MSNSKLRALQTALEHGFNRSYRFCETGRRGINWLADDLIPMDKIDDENYSFHPEAVRRFLYGVTDCETKIRTFPVPRDELLRQIVRFVRENRLISESALKDHNLKITQDLIRATQTGVINPVNPAIGTAIWGDFLAVQQDETKVEYVVHTWFLDANEPFCRVRKQLMLFQRIEGELFCDFSRRVRTLNSNCAFTQDYFATLDDLGGVIFCGENERTKSPLSKVEMNKKGRINSYAQSPISSDNETQFRFVEQPKDIDLVLSIRRKMDDNDALLMAA